MEWDGHLQTKNGTHPLAHIHVEQGVGWSGVSLAQTIMPVEPVTAVDRVISWFIFSWHLFSLPIFSNPIPLSGRPFESSISYSLDILFRCFHFRLQPPATKSVSVCDVYACVCVSDVFVCV